MNPQDVRRVLDMHARGAGLLRIARGTRFPVHEVARILAAHCPIRGHLSHGDIAVRRRRA